MTSAWRRLRPSTIENTQRSGTSGWSSRARNSSSWASVRCDSVVGISGTSRQSAAANTFSEARDTWGGQSRKTRS